jgi:hypothetical protein
LKQELNFDVNTNAEPVPDVPTVDREKTSSSSVSCPVCQISILQRNINVHLDGCLGRGKIIQSDTDSVTTESTNKDKIPHSVPISAKPSRIHKVVYYLMKDGDLKKVLRKEGLDIQGDRKTLISRHQRFTVLWNSQCDSENPMTRVQIIKQLKREEQNLSEAAAVPSPTTASFLNYDRNTRPEIIESKQKAYIQKNKSQFAQLVQQLKERKKSETNDCKKDLENTNRTQNIQDSFNDITDKSIANSGPPIISLSSDRVIDGEEHQISKVFHVENKPCQASDLEVGKTLYDDIRTLPDESESKITSQVCELMTENNLPPLSSSTPKMKRSTQFLNTCSSITDESIYQDSQVPAETVKSENVEDEPISKRQKTNKLSLSRRYGAGSSKKSQCPVCHDLIRESIINFHLDHCLGREDYENPDSNTDASRKTRSAHKVENEKDIKKENRSTSQENIDGRQTLNENTSIPDEMQCSSADLFKDDSEEDFCFPLSQLDNIVPKTKVLTRQESQTSTQSSSDTKLLNITPDIIENLDDETEAMDFSEMIENNLKEDTSINIEKTLTIPPQSSIDQAESSHQGYSIRENFPGMQKEMSQQEGCSSKSEKLQNAQSEKLLTKSEEHNKLRTGQQNVRNVTKIKSVKNEENSDISNVRGFCKRTTRATSAAKSNSIR